MPDYADAEFIEKNEEICLNCQYCQKPAMPDMTLPIWKKAPKKEANLKTVIFGGVFDPIHNGHTRTAALVYERIKPDFFYFVPSRTPPHKNPKRVTDAEHRYNMTKIAAESLGENFSVSRLELDAAGVSYTVETLEHFRQNGVELFFVIGADNIDQIASWRRGGEIGGLATMVIAGRGGYEIDRSKIPFPNFLIIEQDIELSSTFVRECENKQDYVCDGVYKYITENNLYPPKVKNLEERVRETLDDKRWRHTLLVCDAARSLARHYGVNEDDAYTAALLHDYAKGFSLKEMLNICAEYDIIPDEVQRESAALLHGVVAEAVSYYEFHVTNSEILNAIRYHTTLCAHPEPLTKVVFLADCIEDSRVYAGADEIRQAAYSDIDGACVMALDGTLKRLTKLNRPVHPDTIHAKNFLLGDIL